MDMYMEMAMTETNRINAMEEKIAREEYGCSYSELDEDTRGEVTMDAYDRLDEE